MNAIEFKNVWKKFNKGEKFDSLRDAIPNMIRNITKGGNGDLKGKEFWALQDVSFNIGKGDVVGIVGPNGAGKSTTLKLLSRIIAPTKGSIHINGRLSALIEVSAGFHHELTGRENVYLNGTILGMRKKEIDAKFDDIVEFSGIGEFIDTPVKRYSSGMYTRLGFSVAAHMDPDILLVDEVLAVGDMTFQAKCAQKMRELLATGSTIVLVSHNLSLIQNMCKRAILINKGQILKDGSPEEVIPHYRNLVYRQEEESFKKKIIAGDFKIRIEDESIVKISGVKIFDGTMEEKSSFNVGEPISIKVDYEVVKAIEDPIISLDIVRADGVLCCSSTTKQSGVSTNTVNGTNSFVINLGNTNLSPGIYVARISIWDREMIHPYLIRRKDIFRIEVNGINESTKAVFMPKIEWRVGAK